MIRRARFEVGHDQPLERWCVWLLAKGFDDRLQVPPPPEMPARVLLATKRTEEEARAWLEGYAFSRSDDLELFGTFADEVTPDVRKARAQRKRGGAK